jgi:bifunctional ADP-heptose synthase (sugar kinase/adenylyltransferase)
MTDTVTTPQPTPLRILLVGDNCLDVYQFGTVDRISPEAPVPVFVAGHTEQRDGMAGNVRNNLEALGCDVDFLFDGISKKTRLIDSRSKQQIVRIDNDADCRPVDITTALDYDAIVISDYNKGTVSYELIERLRREFAGPIFVDTKKTDLARLEGCIVKINQLEYNRITSACTDLIVTLGDRGAKWNEIHFTSKRVEVADVCGAGDTFLAALAYKYLVERSIPPAINFAIRASAITVQHIGNYAPTSKEIQ